MKINKKLILMLVLVLMVCVLGGCKQKSSEGVKNKVFLKDMDELYILIDKSIEDREYYKDDIDEIIEKMNEVEYLKKLNKYEVSILELIKDTLVKIESDLTTGKKMIQSYTFDEIESIYEMIDN